MQQLRVLICDDEAGMRSGVARALRDYRVSVPDLGETVAFEVETAESGEEALDVIAARRPDVLLLDHKLPGMSGLDVLDELGGKKDGDMLVVMITAYASLETAVTAIKRGAYDFLAKPFTPAELRGTIQKAAVSLVLTRQARHLARERRQIRFDFIRVLAHELKAPLGAIEGYLQIVRDRSAGDDPAAYARMVDRSLLRAQGMRKLILDLLDLTRIESGRKQREVKPIDVRDIARQAIETSAPDAGARGIRMHLHADAPVPMCADPGEIEIILNNLVSNAVKYNVDGGCVDVRLSAHERFVTIEVADTGIGMAPEEAARLFEEFVRIKNEKTRHILGSGLGLSIVRKLVLLYGGETRVSSVPGEGSTFTIALGRETAAHPGPAADGDHDA